MRQVTATEKLRAVNEGMMAEAEFVRQMRQLYPMYVTQYNGFKDTVQILKNKGMLFEDKKEQDYTKHNSISDDSLRRAIDIELEVMGLMSHGNVSFEDQEKAKNKALKNLEKDPLHYYNLISGESSKVDKHDKPTEFKKGKEVDTFNGLKKADLKENLNEASQEESVASYIIKHYAHPKTGKSMIDDEIVSDFFKTHPEWEEIADGTDEGMQRLIDTFEEYLFVNYDIPSAGDAMEEKVAKSVEDVIDPHDYVEIGHGYLKGFNRPHSLSDDDLEVLGRKVTDKLFKGDFDAAKAKFVGEVMGIDRKGNQKPETEPSRFKGRDKSVSRAVAAEALSDEDMKAIEKYGHADKPVKAFKPGDMWSNDFDYEGMLEFGLKIRLNTPVQTLQALYDSFEDVNYHSENQHLGNAIDAIKDGDKSDALDNIRNFKKAVKQTLIGINEGGTPVRELEEGDPMTMAYTKKVKDIHESDVQVDLVNQTVNKANSQIVNAAGLADFLLDVIERLAEKESEGILKNPMIKNAMRFLQKARETGGKKMQQGQQQDQKPVNERVGGLQEFISLIEDRAAESGFSEAEEAEEVIEALRDHYTLNEEAINEPIQLQDALERYSFGEILDTAAEFYHTEGEHDVSKMAVRFAREFRKTLDDFDGGVNEEPNEGNKFEEERLKAIKAGKKEFSVDGKTFPVKGADAEDEKRAKMVKENVKAIIQNVLKEKVLNEAATNNLADWGAGYEGFEGVKSVVNTLENIVTEIESFYDKIGDKIAKAMAGTANFRNDEGLKIGAFIAPSLEAAFKKDLRPIQKAGFLNKVELPKVRTITQADIDAHNSGEKPLGEQEPAKQHVFTPAINENKKK